MMTLPAVSTIGDVEHVGRREAGFENRTQPGVVLQPRDRIGRIGLQGGEGRLEDRLHEHVRALLRFAEPDRRERRDVPRAQQHDDERHEEGDAGDLLGLKGLRGMLRCWFQWFRGSTVPGSTFSGSAFRVLRSTF